MKCKHIFKEVKQVKKSRTAMQYKKQRIGLNSLAINKFMNSLNNNIHVCLLYAVSMYTAFAHMLLNFCSNLRLASLVL